MDGCEIHEYTVYTTQGGGFYEKKDFFFGIRRPDVAWPNHHRLDDEFGIVDRWKEVCWHTLQFQPLVPGVVMGDGG